MRQAAKWLLYAQLALTAAALVLAFLSMTSGRTTTSSGMTVVGGAMVSTPVIASGVLLIAAAVLALVALRRPSLHTWAVIVLLAPLLSAVVTSVTATQEEDVVGLQYLETYDVGRQVQETMRWLEWSSWLAVGAMLLAAAAAILLLQLRRKQVA